MELLDKYLSSKAEVFAYFGYVEDWVAIPLEDARKYYWRLPSGDAGEVAHADTEGELVNEEGNYYVDEIYTQRFLPKWVYRGAEFTLVCCNPGVDGNKFLRVFDNAKERP